jgi:hypothetical protein
MTACRNTPLGRIGARTLGSSSARTVQQGGAMNTNCWNFPPRVGRYPSTITISQPDPSLTDQADEYGANFETRTCAPNVTFWLNADIMRACPGRLLWPRNTTWCCRHWTDEAWPSQDGQFTASPSRGSSPLIPLIALGTRVHTADPSTSPASRKPPGRSAAPRSAWSPCSLIRTEAVHQMSGSEAMTSGGGRRPPEIREL